MELNSLLQSNQQENSPIQQDVDPGKFELIKQKLCAKRKTLEDATKDTTLDPAIREEKALDLIQLKEAMRTFGVSDVDYEVYLVKSSPK